MKTFTHVLSIVFLCLFSFSCENENINNSDSSPGNLILIIESINIANSGDQTITYSYNNNQNTQKVYSFNNNTNYTLNTFDNDLVVLSDYYDETDVIMSSTIYSYDSLGRMISHNYLEVNAGVLILKTEMLMNYTANQIIVSKITYDVNGIPTENDLATFTLNSDNLIIKRESGDGLRISEATYNNGNLATYTNSGFGDYDDGYGTFTYTNELASDSYQKDKYLFGSEWRNNVMIQKWYLYSFKALAEQGTNYLSSYSYKLSIDSSEAVSLNAIYEWNDNGQLMTQTKNKLFFNSPHNRVLTYQYQ